MDSLDHEFVERPAHLGECLGAVGSVDDELTDE